VAATASITMKNTKQSSLNASRDISSMGLIRHQRKHPPLPRRRQHRPLGRVPPRRPLRHPLKPGPPPHRHPRRHSTHRTSSLIYAT
jgi:hypothetical protein